MIPLTLEDFEQANPALPGAVAGISPDEAEAARAVAYEQGYKAGWDDATQTEAQDQSRIGAELARNLQDASFTFHEARSNVIQSMEPVLKQLVEKLLPDLVVETFGMTIVEELGKLVEDRADVPIELVVCPSNAAAVDRQLSSVQVSSLQVIEEPSLAEGQAFLRVGQSERKIDMSHALDRILLAIQSLYALNERTIRDAG